MQRSRDGAFVPETAEEIADDARLCREAGAAIVHVHARDDEGRNTGDVDTVYVCVGGADGYVGRDGQVPDDETGQRARPIAT